MIFANFLYTFRVLSRATPGDPIHVTVSAKKTRASQFGLVIPNCR